MGQVLSRYHISLDVDDRAGVLAVVAGAFAEAGVSLSTVRQEGRDADASWWSSPTARPTPRWPAPWHGWPNSMRCIASPR